MVDNPLINNIYSKSSSIILLIIALGYGYLAQQIPLDFWSEEEAINARSLPYLLALTGSCLSFALVILSFLPRRNIQLEQDLPGQDQSTTAPTHDWRSLALILGLMVLFAISIELLGFLLSSSLFLVFGFYILGSRSPRSIFLTAIPLVLVIWLLLDTMGIYLAEGSLFAVNPVPPEAVTAAVRATELKGQ